MYHQFQKKDIPALDPDYPKWFVSAYFFCLLTKPSNLAFCLILFSGLTWKVLFENYILGTWMLSSKDALTRLSVLIWCKTAPCCHIHSCNKLGLRRGGLQLVAHGRYWVCVQNAYQPRSQSLFLERSTLEHVWACGRVFTKKPQPHWIKPAI